jgi:valyl-tRNA synthetase
VGKTCILPLMNREIPIVADDYAELEFGTGAVKMTPAHDPNDFEVGLRHNLEIIRVIGDDGKINENGGKYAGMDRYECRKQIVADLEEAGYLVKTEPYSHNVGTCYRCHSDVEPLISAQWFVKMEPLAKEALRVVNDGEVKFVPERFTRFIPTGWRTCMTGASPVSFGGAIRSPRGTATSAATSTSAGKIPPSAKSAAARI